MNCHNGRPELRKPTKRDFIAWRGTNWNRNVRIYVKSGDIRTLKDLTGWTAKAEIRPEENSDTLSAEMHVGVTGVDGLISLALLPEQTAGMLDDVYYWDLKTVDDTGETRYLLYGKFYLKGKVTK
jgi:hypothetical protein